MSEVAWLRKWYAYNAVGRLRYLETFSRLSPDELSRDRGASFPSLIDIFGHSLGGTSFWIVRMSTLYGEPFTPFDGPEKLSLEDLRRFNRATEELVDRLFSRLSEEDLDRSFLVPKVPGYWDEDFMASVRSTLHHVIEHELQHRGELNALLWQIDVEPPILDWDAFEEMQTHQSTAHP
ncbi:MAG: DinB family protein [Nitrososphaerales archaeon]